MRAVLRRLSGTPFSSPTVRYTFSIEGPVDVLRTEFERRKSTTVNLTANIRVHGARKPLATLSLEYMNYGAARRMAKLGVGQS